MSAGGEGGGGGGGAEAGGGGAAAPSDPHLTDLVRPLLSAMEATLVSSVLEDSTEASEPRSVALDTTGRRMLASSSASPPGEPIGSISGEEGL